MDLPCHTTDPTQAGRLFESVELPESYNFAADVLEDIMGAMREEGHALTDCQKGFFNLVIRTYRHMGLMQ